MKTAWSTFLTAASRELERSSVRDPRLFPHYSEDGQWRLLDIGETSSWQGETYEHGNWTAGFWFGTMWLASLGTGRQEFADAARERLPLLPGRAGDATTHDLGFLFYPSIVLGQLCDFVGDAEPALDAARMIARRFNEPGRYIQAFGPVGEARSSETSTVDTLMNLPLLWWAYARTGESRFYEVARHHARTSARLLVRPDASTIHLMLLDPVTGAFSRESTLQGADASSSWSRGQAWAVAGFAWAYAVTGEPELLMAAERTGTYYEDHAGVDQLPSWDFANPSNPPLPDASAAAVVALGYLVLGEVHPGAEDRRHYTASARRLLDTIGREALNTSPDVDGILLRSNYSVPHNRGIDGATAWGDFYVGLALAIAEGVVPLHLALAVDPSLLHHRRSRQ